VENVQVLTHPLAAARLTTLRDASTDRLAFRVALRELAMMLVYEATRDLRTVSFEVATPLTSAPGSRLADVPLLVPVLRAGLGMAQAALDLLPEAQTGFVGLARDEQTHQPRAYLESLPDRLERRPVLVLDPMLATGGSLMACLDMLASHGATDVTVVCVLAAPEGVARLQERMPPVRLVTAAIDQGLDENAFIVPGLGDAGDRQFGEV